MLGLGTFMNYFESLKMVNSEDVTGNAFLFG